jgi:hypothetical protein
MCQGDYRKKLTTPAKAVAYLAQGSTLVHGMGAGEPPALLSAIADRVRVGDLKGLKGFPCFPWSTWERPCWLRNSVTAYRPIAGLSAARTGNW